MNIDETLDFPRYSKSLDFDALEKEYPPPPAFFQSVYRMPPPAWQTLQEKRFLKLIARGWEIPFFKKRWTAAGLQPGDIRSLDDITKIGRAHV